MKYEIEIDLGDTHLRQTLEVDEDELLRRIRALEKRYPQATITWREAGSAFSREPRSGNRP